MSELIFDQARCANVFCHGTLRNGIYRIWGDDPSQVSHVLECAIGLRQPTLGSCTIDGINPANTPQLRARIGSLLEEESAYANGRVADVLAQLQQLRGGHPQAAFGVLDAIGAGNLAPRRTQELTANERRIVALGLALSLDEPKLLALHTPLTLSDVDLKRVLVRLRAVAGRAVVLLAMPSNGRYAEFVQAELQISEGRMLVTSDRTGADSTLHPQQHSAERDVEFRILGRGLERLVTPLHGAAPEDTLELLGPDELLVTTRSPAEFGQRLVSLALSESVQLFLVRSKPAARRATQSPATTETASPTNGAYGGTFPPNGTGSL